MVDGRRLVLVHLWLAVWYTVRWPSLNIFMVLPPGTYCGRWPPLSIAMLTAVLVFGKESDRLARS